MTHRESQPVNRTDAQRHIEAIAHDAARFLSAHIARNVALGVGGCVLLTGPTRAGKSLAGLRLADDLRAGGLTATLALPAVARGDIVPRRLVSASGASAEAGSFADTETIASTFGSVATVIVDEVQFTPELLWDALEDAVRRRAADGGWSVLLGMLYASNRQFFPLTVRLRAHADVVIGLTAVCQVCGRPTALYSQRLLHGRPAPSSLPLLLGPTEAITYEPRCATCHVVDGV